MEKGKALILFPEFCNVGLVYPCTMNVSRYSHVYSYLMKPTCQFCVDITNSERKVGGKILLRGTNCSLSSLSNYTVQNNKAQYSIMDLTPLSSHDISYKFCPEMDVDCDSLFSL